MSYSITRCLYLELPSGRGGNSYPDVAVRRHPHALGNTSARARRAEDNGGVGVRAGVDVDLTVEDGTVVAEELQGRPLRRIGQGCPVEDPQTAVVVAGPDIARALPG